MLHLSTSGKQVCSRLEWALEDKAGQDAGLPPAFPGRLICSEATRPGCQAAPHLAGNAATSGQRASLWMHHAAQLFPQDFSKKQEPACLPAFQIRLSPAGLSVSWWALGFLFGEVQDMLHAEHRCLLRSMALVLWMSVLVSAPQVQPCGPREAVLPPGGQQCCLGHHTAPTHSQFRFLCSGLHYNTERCPEIPLDIFIILQDLNLK